LIKIIQIPLSELRVNRANDRHGELKDEAAAIAWLFKSKESHMRKLASDIVQQAEIYEPPLVFKIGTEFVVFDGNRRVTCLKLLANPASAPTSALESFFTNLSNNWNGGQIYQIQCQVESNRDRIDAILFRRHTGSQGGIGQSTWDDRMKRNFVSRTGKCGKVDVAEEIERLLHQNSRILSQAKLPRSTMNRLLSSNKFRQRLGFIVKDKAIHFTTNKEASLSALTRVANDLSEGNVVLGDIWDSERKTNYLNMLQDEGVLPEISKFIDMIDGVDIEKSERNKNNIIPLNDKIIGDKSKLIIDSSLSLASTPSLQKNLIPRLEFDIEWTAPLKRHKEIWIELQFKLDLNQHPNAISVLFRVLLELSLDNYIKIFPESAREDDKLQAKVLKIADHMIARGKIDKNRSLEIKKIGNGEKIFSAKTLNSYVHSPDFAPSSNHLKAIWDTMANFIVTCLKA
jgi:hypothetical protein